MKRVFIFVEEGNSKHRELSFFLEERGSVVGLVGLLLVVKSLDFRVGKRGAQRLDGDHIDLGVDFLVLIESGKRVGSLFFKSDIEVVVRSVRSKSGDVLILNILAIKRRSIFDGALLQKIFAQVNEDLIVVRIDRENSPSDLGSCCDV